MRVLSNDDVEKVLTAEECMAALRIAYREHSQGLADNRPRNHSYLSVTREGLTDCQYRFKSQEGGNVSSGVWALRVTSEMIGSETVEGVKRRRIIPAATGDKYCGLVMLFSTTKLEPLARAILKGAREMVRELAMSDATFAEIKQELSNEHMTDLVITIAFYCAVVRVLATMQMDNEPYYKEVLQQYPIPGVN